jgi:hypothetical protein
MLFPLVCSHGVVILLIIWWFFFSPLHFTISWWSLLFLHLSNTADAAGLSHTQKNTHESPKQSQVRTESSTFNAPREKRKSMSGYYGFNDGDVYGSGGTDPYGEDIVAEPELQHNYDEKEHNIGAKAFADSAPAKGAAAEEIATSPAMLDELATAKKELQAALDDLRSYTSMFRFPAPAGNVRVPSAAAPGVADSRPAPGVVLHATESSDPPAAAVPQGEAKFQHTFAQIPFASLLFDVEGDRRSASFLGPRSRIAELVHVTKDDIRLVKNHLDCDLAKTPGVPPAFFCAPLPSDVALPPVQAPSRFGSPYSPSRRANPPFSHNHHLGAFPPTPSSSAATTPTTQSATVTPTGAAGAASPDQPAMTERPRQNKSRLSSDAINRLKELRVRFEGASPIFVNNPHVRLFMPPRGAPGTLLSEAPLDVTHPVRFTFSKAAGAPADGAAASAAEPPAFAFGIIADPGPSVRARLAFLAPTDRGACRELGAFAVLSGAAYGAWFAAPPVAGFGGFGGQWKLDAICPGAIYEFALLHGAHTQHATYSGGRMESSIQHHAELRTVDPSSGVATTIAHFTFFDPSKANKLHFWVSLSCTGDSVELR